MALQATPIEQTIIRHGRTSAGTLYFTPVRLNWRSSGLSAHSSWGGRFIQHLWWLHSRFLQPMGRLSPGRRRISTPTSRQPLTAFKTRPLVPPRKRLAAPPVSRFAATLRAVTRPRPHRIAPSAFTPPRPVRNHIRPQRPRLCRTNPNAFQAGRRLLPRKPSRLRLNRPRIRRQPRLSLNRAPLLKQRVPRWTSRLLNQRPQQKPTPPQRIPFRHPPIPNLAPPKLQPAMFQPWVI